MKACIDAAQDTLLAASAEFTHGSRMWNELMIIVDALDCLYDTPASHPALVKFANHLCKLLNEDDRGNEP
jgi:hypothetical protein